MLASFEAIQLVKCSDADAEMLATFGRRTFYEAFAAHNTARNMEQYLDHAFSVEKINTELENPNTAFFFALLEEAPIGYMKLNFWEAQNDYTDDNSLEVERIYVEKSYWGRGIAQQLMERAISIAKSMRMDYLWLGVWEKNPRAIRFYEKEGFIASGAHPFMLGEDLQTDIIMKLTL